MWYCLVDWVGCLQSRSFAALRTTTGRGSVASRRGRPAPGRRPDGARWDRLSFRPSSTGWRASCTPSSTQPARRDPRAVDCPHVIAGDGGALPHDGADLRFSRAVVPGRFLRGRPNSDFPLRASLSGRPSTTASSFPWRKASPGAAVRQARRRARGGTARVARVRSGERRWPLQRQGASCRRGGGRSWSAAVRGARGAAATGRAAHTLRNLPALEKRLVVAGSFLDQRIEQLHDLAGS